MADAEILPRCFGPYLRYAISTEFRDFAPFDKRSKLFLLVEFKRPDAQTTDPEAEFERAMESFHLQFGPANDDTRYVTIRADKSAVLSPNTIDSWNSYVDRVELSLPLM